VNIYPVSLILTDELVVYSILLKRRFQALCDELPSERADVQCHKAADSLSKNLLGQALISPF
jgi:hypothetical protein